MRWREQSQNSISIDRSCLDSSLSLFRHSMKSLRPPWGPSSQMKAHSLGKRSSRCVRPAEEQIKCSDKLHDDLSREFRLFKKMKLLILTCEYLETYLCQRRQSGLVKHTDAAHLLNFSRVDPLPSYWFQDVSHRGRLLKCSLEEVCQHTAETHKRCKEPSRNIFYSRENLWFGFITHFWLVDCFVMY